MECNGEIMDQELENLFRKHDLKPEDYKDFDSDDEETRKDIFKELSSPSTSNQEGRVSNFDKEITSERKSDQPEPISRFLRYMGRYYYFFLKERLSTGPVEVQIMRADIKINEEKITKYYIATNNTEIVSLRCTIT